MNTCDNGQKEMGLFGEPLPPLKAKKKGRERTLDWWERTAGYRWAEKGEQRCRDCYYRRTYRYNRPYHKCAVIGGGSPNTDIRLNKTCIFFRKQKEGEQ
jgi:hypothetical protein